MYLALETDFRFLLLVGLRDSALDATDIESPDGLSRLGSNQNDLGVTTLIRTVVTKSERILADLG